MNATNMQEFTVERGDKRIFGKITVPDGNGPWPVVIFSHGFSASRVYDHGMEREFIEQGLAFVAFDFCGGGLESQSSGTRLEMSVLTEADDLEAVINWVCAQKDVDERYVFLLGSSQGGYVSTYVASGRPEDIAGLVLFFPAFNIGDDARAQLDACGGIIPDQFGEGQLLVGRRYIEDALAVDIFARIGKYPGDVLIVHGALDEIVPIEYSRRAAQTFPGPCTLEVIDELGHGFHAYPPAIHEQALGLAIEFFKAHLG